MITQSVPEIPSNPLFNDDEATHIVSHSASLNSETSASSSGQKGADLSRIAVECPAGAAPSQFSDPTEAPGSGLNHSPSIGELRRDHDCCTNAGGLPTASSMPCDADADSNGRLPNDCLSAEAIRSPSCDVPNSDVHSHTPCGGVSARRTEHDFSEARHTDLSRSTPLSTREHPIDHSPQAGPAIPKSAHPSAILPCRAGPDPDATPNAAVSGSSGSEDLPLPEPPPEVAVLLSTQSIGSVVSPVLARNSPLVPWQLPSEIGYFWLGFFKISAVKVFLSLPIRLSSFRASCLLPR